VSIHFITVLKVPLNVLEGQNILRGNVGNVGDCFK